MKYLLLSLCCFIVCSITAITTYAQGDWQLQANANTLRSSKFINSQTGFGVGDLGTVLKTTNGGQDWFAQNSGTKNNLFSIFFNADGVTGWVSGDKGCILKTTDGGITWGQQTSGYNAPYATGQ